MQEVFPKKFHIAPFYRKTTTEVTEHPEKKKNRHCELFALCGYIFFHNIELETVHKPFFSRFSGSFELLFELDRKSAKIIQKSDEKGFVDSLLYRLTDYLD